MPDDTELASLKREMREVAREEARAVYDEFADVTETENAGGGDARITAWKIGV